MRDDQRIENRGKKIARFDCDLIIIKSNFFKREKRHARKFQKSYF